jgi:CYTH domain-containing protein
VSTTAANETTNRLELEFYQPPVEIERKFLVANDEWRRSVVRSVSIRDGLLGNSKDRKVRVRISGSGATIAIKGPRTGFTRAEFEYDVPLSDAEWILSTMCHDDVVEKERYFVEDAGAVWHIDVYRGILDGVVIAEVELERETQEPALPRWIGREVTGDLSYTKINMIARRTGSPR